MLDRRWSETRSPPWALRRASNGLRSNPRPRLRKKRTPGSSEGAASWRSAASLRAISTMPGRASAPRAGCWRGSTFRRRWMRSRSSPTPRSETLRATAGTCSSRRGASRGMARSRKRKLPTARCCCTVPARLRAAAASALGASRSHEREGLARGAFEQRAQLRALVRQRLAEGVSLLEEERWEEARGKLKLAAELDPGRPQVQALLERAGAEASRARALAEARAALARMELAGAKLRLAEVPDDSPLAAEAREVAAQLGRALEDAVRAARARARAGEGATALKLLDAVLAAEPARADALELKASVSAPVARAPP